MEDLIASLNEYYFDDKKKQYCFVTGSALVVELTALDPQVPFKNAEDDTSLANALLLRTDWKKLFEMGEWTIDNIQDEYFVCKLGKKMLSDSYYNYFDGYILGGWNADLAIKIFVTIGRENISQQRVIYEQRQLHNAQLEKLQQQQKNQQGYPDDSHFD